MKKIMIFLTLIGVLVWNIAPRYSMDKRNTDESKMRYIELVCSLQDIRTLNKYKIINFGKVTYFNGDCSVFLKIKNNSHSKILRENILSELKEKKWNIIYSCDQDVVLEKDGIKLKLFIEQFDNKFNQNKNAWTLMVSDIRDVHTKEYYKSKDFLKGVI